MTKPAQDLPPVMIRKDFETDEEYAEYLAIESDEFNPTPATEEQREEVAEIAKNTITTIAGKKIPIGLRMPERDVRRAKSLALRKGVPYQTLMISVFHQYLDGNLVEK